MLRKELRTLVNLVPENWQISVSVLLGQLDAEDREIPEYRSIFLGYWSLKWAHHEINFCSRDGSVYLTIVHTRYTSEKATSTYSMLSLGIHPKDANYWVREAIRLAPRRTDVVSFEGREINCKLSMNGSGYFSLVPSKVKVGDVVRADQLAIGTKFTADWGFPEERPYTYLGPGLVYEAHRDHVVERNNGLGRGFINKDTRVTVVSLPEPLKTTKRMLGDCAVGTKVRIAGGSKTETTGRVSRIGEFCVYLNHQEWKGGWHHEQMVEVLEEAPTTNLVDTSSNLEDSPPANVGDILPIEKVPVGTTVRVDIRTVEATDDPDLCSKLFVVESHDFAEFAGLTFVRFICLNKQVMIRHKSKRRFVVIKRD